MGPTAYPQLPCTVYTPFGQLEFRLNPTHRGPVRQTLEEMLTEGVSPVVELVFPFEQTFRTYWEWLTRRELTAIPAAGGVVFSEKGEVLLIYRKGKWDLPKGKLDPGEEMEEAAVREVEEETGLLAVSLEDYLCQTYHIYRDAHAAQNVKPWALKTTWWYRMSALSDAPLVPQAAEQISEVRWFTRDELQDLAALDTHENIRRVLAVALAH